MIETSVEAEKARLTADGAEERAEADNAAQAVLAARAAAEEGLRIKKRLAALAEAQLVATE